MESLAVKHSLKAIGRRKALKINQHVNKHHRVERTCVSSLTV